MNEHHALRGRHALKGGTALNLFFLDLPRLSLDIDINYVGSGDRETMLKARPSFERALEAVCMRQGYAPRRTPDAHAGGKWRMAYVDARGRGANLAVDVNYMLRLPLWPLAHLDSKPLGDVMAESIPVVEKHELVGGKLAALLTRRASRDLFDACQLFRRSDWNWERLRLSFVVHGAGGRKDWRQVSVDDVGFDRQELQSMLLPTLSRAAVPDPASVESWGQSLVEECRELIGHLLPLRENETAFLEALNERGEILPGLITDDAAMVARLAGHPMMRWKALNVRKFRGLPPLEPDVA